MTNPASECHARRRRDHRFRYALLHAEEQDLAGPAPAGDALSEANADCVLARYAIEAVRKSLRYRIA